jgi:hypothetical protein
LAVKVTAPPLQMVVVFADIVIDCITGGLTKTTIGLEMATEGDTHGSLLNSWQVITSPLERLLDAKSGEVTPVGIPLTSHW